MPSVASVIVCSIREDRILASPAQLNIRPEVLAVVLFGSLADGRPSVGRDVDLPVILASRRI